MVVEITPSSPADDAGLDVGDVIVRIDATTIADAPDLTAVIGDHQPGDNVAVVVDRDGTEHTLHVTLATRPVS